MIFHLITPPPPSFSTRKSTNYGHELKPKQTLYMYFRFARIPNTVPHADLPETVITSAIEKVIVSDANPVIKPKPLPVTASSLSTVKSICFSPSLVFNTPFLLLERKPLIMRRRTL